MLKKNGSESAGTASFLIHRDIYSDNRTNLSEVILDILPRSSPWDVTDVEKTTLILWSNLEWGNL
jgi:hypothetical protein